MDNLTTSEFIQQQDMFYLNHAAVAPWPLRTANAVKEFANQNHLEGASHYPQWLEVEIRLRSTLARLINAPSPDDIALVKNTSEGLSFVAHGIEWHDSDNIVIPDCEFPSNRIVWESLTQRYGVEVRQVDIHVEQPEQAILDACDRHTRLISASTVQYADGLCLYLDTIGDYCADNNILFCVDAIQSIGALPIDVQAIHADFVVADAHKWMLGPEGIALFYSSALARQKIKLHEYGWHMIETPFNFDSKLWQEASSARRFECGSPNMLGIHAMAASISLLEEVSLNLIASRIQDNSRYLFELIKNHPALSLLTPCNEGRFSGIVSFRHEKVDNNQLYNYLMENKVICAFRGGAIRFSPHFYNTHSQLQEAMELVHSFKV